MANRHRGEIDAELNGVSRRLVLTLGALAELEAACGADDLVALADRFASGRIKAADLVRIVGAGLRGAGDAVTDAEVAAMTTPGGAAGFAAIAADLLVATFGAGSPVGSAAPGGERGDASAQKNPPAPQDRGNG
ncbi:gene transfer agent (GTA) orfg10 [Rhodovulum sp. PH10]|uniref:gene transfer agent family protein n=1 Tax=Rhodovulum sp. PH10 TaxID=1187851 RepID=UPI00027C26DC|nr:gene transfer agent family protein [Rhodovulum sp. PH10]EJW10156.1 gene transfer agent (GTA) orfg10 [Rhodovulum sp. PH10]